MIEGGAQVGTHAIGVDKVPLLDELGEYVSDVIGFDGLCLGVSTQYRQGITIQGATDFTGGLFAL